MKKYFYLIILLIISCDSDNKKTIDDLIKEGNLEELQERRSSLIIQKVKLIESLMK